MGDVAQILGVLHNSSNNNDERKSTSKSQKPPIAPPSHIIPKSIQNTSVILNSKPVLKVLSSGQSAPAATHGQKLLSTSLPPIVPSHNLPLQTTTKKGTNISKEANNCTPNNATKTPPSPINTASNQISYVKINNKAISTKKARSWVYAPFTNSARKDRLKLHHWVRAGVEYPEYPYARFNIHLDELSYRNEVLEIENANNNNNNGVVEGTAGTIGGGGGGPLSSGNVHGNRTAIQNRTEEEINAAADLFYEQHLQHEEWSQSETDTLLELCRVYQLRWPVIMDRWIGKFGTLSSKKVEDLQHRYYTIGYILNRMKVERAAKIEAENLAKAMAAANQSVSSMVGGGIGGMGPIGGTTGISGISGISGIGPSPEDIKENETLKAKHMLSTAIATSSSNAINSLVGEVKPNLQPPVPVPQTGTSNQPTFDLDAERERRQVLDVIWARTKEEELEEIELRNELKLVEAQIRKMKKSGGHILAATAAASSDTGNNGQPGSTGGLASGASSTTGIDSKPSSRVQSPMAQSNTTAIDKSSTKNNPKDTNNILKSQFAPIPTPGTPYLQSGRQKQPSTNSKLGLNRSTLKRMDQVLQELKIPTKEKDLPLPLLPTKRVCDLYDHVRRDTLTLLSLQKIMLERENEVISRRMRLEKMSGTIVQQQEQQQREAAHAAAAAAAAAEAAAKAAAEAAAKAAANKAKAAGGKNSNSNNTTGGNGNSNGSVSGKKSSSGAGATSGSGKGGSKSKSSSSGSNNTTKKSSSTSSKKKSTSGSGTGGKGTKEKKNKKKSGEGGTTKKRKSTKKKQDSDSSKKGTSSSTAAGSKTTAAASSKAASSKAASSKAAKAAKATNNTSSSTTTTSTIISNNAGGTGMVVGSAATISASSLAMPTTATTTPVTTKTSRSPKKGNETTLDSDGKPAKKRAKKSTS